MNKSFVLTALLVGVASVASHADGAHARQTLGDVLPSPQQLASAERYEHRHGANAGTDVDFGNPADAGTADRAIAFILPASGAISPSGLAVAARERIRFDLRNGSGQPVAFVVGDEHAIREYAAAFKANPDSVKNDFHGVLLAPGQTQPFAWKFDTFGTNTVYAAYVGSDGSYADKMMKIHVAIVSGKR